MTNVTKVRGCCMGIPFGCGTLLLLLLVVGGAAGYIPLSGAFLFQTVVWAGAAVFLAAGALICAQWVRERAAS